MRQCSGFLPTVLRGLSAFVIALCLFAGGCADATAPDSQLFSVSILSEDASQISYSIAAPDSGKSVVAITATYRSGQMQEVHLDSFETGAEVHMNSVRITEGFDDFKVMLLDGTTYAPLCPSGGYRTVRFFDDETLLSEQRVLTGQSAQPPESPTRDGYLFTGWGADYTSVFEDMDLTAGFTPIDGENLFLLTPASASAVAGETVTFRLKLAGTVELCGFDLRLRYSRDVLEYVGMDADFSFDVTANHVEAGNYIRLNYSGRVNKTSGGDILEVSFRVRDREGVLTRLSVEPVSVIGVDPDDASSLQTVEYTASEGVIWIR